MIRVAVFASGAGSNAINLLETAKRLGDVRIPVVIIDQQTSPLLERIRSEYPDVETALVPIPPMKDVKARREVHETEILDVLKIFQIDWCFLAGYMRMVGPTLLKAFQEPNGTSRIVNIHPSLLPKYPGLDGYEQAFRADDAVSGVTIHFVDAGMDTGPVIKQVSFKREKKDTLETFIERGKTVEWKIYSEVLTLLNDQRTLSAEKKR